MKQIKLPFKIGKEYENWEFDLDVLEYERIPFYDSYLYVGKVNKFLNFLPQKTELIFYWDRLEIVIFTFKDCIISNRQEIRKIMMKNFMKKSETLNKEIYVIKQNMEIWYELKSHNTLIITYGDSNKLSKLNNQ